MNITCKTYDVTGPSQLVDQILVSLRKSGVSNATFQRKTERDPFSGDNKPGNVVECVVQRSLSNEEKRMIEKAVGRIDANAVRHFESLHGAPKTVQPELAAA